VFLGGLVLAGLLRLIETEAGEELGKKRGVSLRYILARTNSSESPC